MLLILASLTCICALNCCVQMNLTVASTEPVFSLRLCSVHPGLALDPEPELQVFKRARVVAAACAVLGTYTRDHDQQKLHVQQARVPPRPHLQPSTTGPMATSAMLTNVSRSNRQRIRALFDAAAHAQA